MYVVVTREITKTAHYPFDVFILPFHCNKATLQNTLHLSIPEDIFCCLNTISQITCGVVDFDPLHFAFEHAADLTILSIWFSRRNIETTTTDKNSNIVVHLTFTLILSKWPQFWMEHLKCMWYENGRFRMLLKCISIYIRREVKYLGTQFHSDYSFVCIDVFLSEIDVHECF